MSPTPIPSPTSASEHIVTQSGNKPLRFRGWLLGTGTVEDSDEDGYMFTSWVRLFRTQSGKFVWAAARVEGRMPENEELDEDAIQRSEATVHQTVDEAWLLRPDQNRKVLEATVIAWAAAARIDDAVRAEQYQEIE